MSKEKINKTTDDWDLESAEIVTPPKRSSRIVFSVQFSREEFEEVSRRAKDAGVKPGAFIRETVLSSGASSEAGPQVTTGSPEASSQVTFSGKLQMSMAQPTEEIKVRETDLASA